jgi:hypothetical protein
MSKINRIKGNKIEFSLDEKVLTGLVLKHFQRKPVDAQIYIVAVGNDIYEIHEKLSHGIVIKVVIELIPSSTDLAKWYKTLINEFDYYLVGGATS